MSGPENADRAAWAENAANTFGEETYNGRTFTDTVAEQPDANGDAYTMITDLIADLLHLGSQHGWDTTAIVRTAVGAFEEEVAEEEENERA